MNNIFRKFFLVVTLLSIVSCGFKNNNIKNYQPSLDSMLLSADKNNNKQDFYDPQDIRGCPVLFSYGKWEYRGRESSEHWGRDRRFLGKVMSSSGYSLNGRSEYFSENLKANPKRNIVYIGPWQKITITKDKQIPFFLKLKTIFRNKQEYDKILRDHKLRFDREIRFVVGQYYGGGVLNIQYESKTQAREKIPQQAFKLLKNKPLPNFENLCHAKWIVKYGYNAYAETKKSFFNPYGTPTGRVLSLGEKK